MEHKNQEKLNTMENFLGSGRNKGLTSVGKHGVKPSVDDIHQLSY